MANAMDSDRPPPGGRTSRRSGLPPSAVNQDGLRSGTTEHAALLQLYGEVMLKIGRYETKVENLAALLDKLVVRPGGMGGDARTRRDLPAGAGQASSSRSASTASEGAGRPYRESQGM